MKSFPPEAGLVFMTCGLVIHEAERHNGQVALQLSVFTIHPSFSTSVGSSRGGSKCYKIDGSKGAAIIGGKVCVSPWESKGV